MRKQDRKFSLKQVLATNITVIALAVLLTASLVTGAATINIYLDDLPASANYTIKTDGTNYWAVRYDGYKASESTDFDTVFNAARLALGSLATGAPGSIEVTTGTYSLNGDLTIGKKTHLSGKGSVKFDVTANLATAAIIIDNTAIEGEWSIENIDIDLNGFNGDGIHASFGASTSASSVGSLVRHMYIHAVKAGYAAIDLNNFMNTEISYSRLSTSGTGLRLWQDTTYESAYFGNSLVSQVRVGLAATNSIGLDIGSNVATYVPIFVEFNHFQVTVAAATRAGTTGIRIRGARELSFIKTYLEQMEIGIDISEGSGGPHAYDINWYATTIRQNYADTTAYKDSSNGVYGIHFFGGVISSAGTLINHTSTAYNAGVDFNQVSFEGGGSMSIGGDNAVDFIDCYGFRTEEWGTGTISASTSAVVDHDLAGTPDHVDVEFKTVSTDPGYIRWSANSTDITFTVGNSGTYTFSWYAKYIP